MQSNFSQFTWHSKWIGPIFPYTFIRLTHDWFVAADIPVANDTLVHYADAIRCNVRRPPARFFTAVNPSGFGMMLM